MARSILRKVRQLAHQVQTFLVPGIAVLVILNWRPF